MEEEDFALPTEGTAQKSNRLFAVKSLVYGFFCLNCVLCCSNIFTYLWFRSLKPKEREQKRPSKVLPSWLRETLQLPSQCASICSILEVQWSVSNCLQLKVLWFPFTFCLRSVQSKILHKRECKITLCAGSFCADFLFNFWFFQAHPGQGQLLKEECEWN